MGISKIQVSPIHTGRRPWGKIILGFFAVILIFSGGFFVGAWKINKLSPDQAVQQLISTAPYFSNTENNESVDFKLFWDVWRQVKDSYVEQPVDERNLFYGAVSGIVNSLGDPYSVFLDPDDSKEFSSDLAGEFEGIGAEIGIRHDQLVIVSPLSDSPAQKAGLRTGDFILSIDDVDTFGMSLDEAVSRIRGKDGTTVRLTVYREGDESTQDYEIIRSVIHVDSVKWSYDEANSVATVEINQFIEDTQEELNTALNEIILKQPQGLILDLRNNPGGFLTTSIEVASKFINSGVIVSEQFSDGSTHDYPATGFPQLVDVPMVVLVNGGSASAAEIVAGALQDYKRAILVGEKTFGKGSVQDFMQFSDGSILKVTVAKWLTPNGRSINHEGIVPDYEVKFTADNVNNDEDPQYDKALEVLKSEIEK